MLHILWDESHIWGLLLARAVRAMKLPHRLVTGRDIAAGLLDQERPAMFLAPGGNARHKAEALGPQGREAVRAYVHSGGQYLGFCGGAGLALTWGAVSKTDKAGGVGLCPWHRAAFDDRLQHFMSGHLFVRSSASGHSLVPEGLPERPLLPVWWPGRFEEIPHPDIAVLAVYEQPGEDFWLADLPIASLPPDIFGAWEDVYGFSITPDYLVAQPCLVYGTYGQGGYTLSYSHLETPASTHANHWLAHLFLAQAGLAPAMDLLPPWTLMTQQTAWQDAHLARMADQMLGLIRTGLEHGLLFQRNDWLLGWRAGIPGASVNNLWAALQSIRGLEPSSAAEAYWREKKETTLAAMELFHRGTVQYLLAERLSLTLSKSLPGIISQAMLKEQRDALFGPPMQPKGVYGDILAILDRLAYLQLSDTGCRAGL